jgi:hypothetical protein
MVDTTLVPDLLACLRFTSISAQPRLFSLGRGNFFPFGGWPLSQAFESATIMAEMPRFRPR